MNFQSKFSARILFKWVAILLLLAAYLVLSVFITIFPVSKIKRRAVRSGNTSFFSTLALIVFGVRVRVRSAVPLNSTKGCLFISNHVSYVDVLVISSLAPSVFITSVELRNTPLLGTLARFAGSLFVERRTPSGLKQEISDIAAALKQGFCVVLFPEATTSDGERVRNFKNSLFQAAIAAGAPVQPVCLRYSRINNQPVSHYNKNHVFYYGGVPFSKHFPAFMSLSSVDIEVAPLERINPGPDTSRKELAEKAHVAISTEYESRELLADTLSGDKEGA